MQRSLKTNKLHIQYSQWQVKRNCENKQHLGKDYFINHGSVISFQKNKGNFKYHQNGMKIIMSYF